MKILLTGVSGYIGGRLLPALIDKGHIIYACIRDKARFPKRYINDNVKIVEVDFLNPNYDSLPLDIDVAFYLIHSMKDTMHNLGDLEELQARNFVKYMNMTSVKHVIYLSGIASDKQLSQHLASRKNVGNIISEGSYATTIFKAAIIIGSGSSSFEIMYDLVDKLPVMVGPYTLNNLCQPIAIRNVVYYLCESMLNPKCMNQMFDIGGPEIISYKNMLLQIAKIRGLSRKVITLKLISAKLCAHWFYFISSVSYKLAVNLSESMKNNEICSENRITEILPQDLFSFTQMVEIALEKISSDNVLSSWKDSFSSSGLSFLISDNINIPQTGVLTYGLTRKSKISHNELIKRLWETGGANGWWYANWLWEARGVLNLFGKGIGMRGRTSVHNISVGDAIDFWRVLIADRENGRLLLYAEMVMPGEGWLDFRVKKIDNYDELSVKATFRPKGISGRLYWLLTKPFHYFLFKGMIKRITE